MMMKLLIYTWCFVLIQPAHSHTHDGLIASSVPTEPAAGAIKFATPHHPHPPRLNPIVVYSNGCSGSSIIHRMLISLLKLRKIDVDGGGADWSLKERTCKPHPWQWESLKPSKNCRLEALLAKDPATAHRDIVFEMFDVAAAHNKTLLINPPPLNKQNSEALRELNATIISSVRLNAFDRVICQVKDCFPGNGDNPDSYPVDEATGGGFNLCFGRRFSNTTVSVHLDTAHLMTQLNNEIKMTMSQNTHLVSLGWEGFVSVTYEDLCAFEYGDVDRSTVPWMRLMTSIGHPFDSHGHAKKTLQNLKNAEGGDYYDSRPPPSSQEKSVQNWAEVKALILASPDKDIRGMVR